MLKWLGYAWTILKALLGGGDTQALRQEAEDKGKLEAENAQQKNALAAASIRDGIDSDNAKLSDNDLDKQLRADWQRD